MRVNLYVFSEEESLERKVSHSPKLQPTLRVSSHLCDLVGGPGDCVVVSSLLLCALRVVPVGSEVFVFTCPLVTPCS